MKKVSKYDNIRIAYKIWMLTESGENILGEGKLHLLIGIAGKGSIRLAANDIGISYRKAWGDIRKAEQLLGFPLVQKQRGGRDGGRTTLTRDGELLLEAYEKMRNDFQVVVNDIIRDFKRKIKGVVRK
jgi:molybdate transport system regulatory protein